MGFFLSQCLCYSYIDTTEDQSSMMEEYYFVRRAGIYGGVFWGQSSCHCFSPHCPHYLHSILYIDYFLGLYLVPCDSNYQKVSAQLKDGASAPEARLYVGKVRIISATVSQTMSNYIIGSTRPSRLFKRVEGLGTWLNQDSSHYSTDYSSPSMRTK